MRQQQQQQQDEFQAASLTSPPARPDELAGSSAKAEVGAAHDVRGTARPLEGPAMAEGGFDEAAAAAAAALHLAKVGPPASGEQKQVATPQQPQQLQQLQQLQQQPLVVAKTQGKAPNKRRPFFNPSDAFCHWWSAVVSLAFLYNFWSLSYRFAFREIDDSTVTVWFMFDYAADLIYLNDIYVNFRTGYLEDGVLQRDPKKIGAHYRDSTLFYLDMLCLLPFDFLYLSFSYCSILRCNKLVKIYKFWSFVDRTERHTNYPNVFRTFTLVHYILVIFHWNACLFHMISKHNVIDIATLYKINDNQCDDILCQYLHAFYWSTLALSLIGDLPRPRTRGEFIYVIVELCFGLFLFASVLGHVANIVTNVSAARKEFQAKLDAVKTFMRTRRVSDDLQNKVIRWFDYLWYSQKSSDEERSVACLPDRLKAEIAIHVNLDTLKRVDIFQNTEAGFLCELVLRLKPVLFSPGDYVCRKNEVGHEMYIVSRGILEVVTDDGQTVVATFRAGSYFGEIAVLNVGSAGNKRTASVRSVGYSDLFCLSKRDLWDVLKDYPNAEARIRAVAEERLSKLSSGGAGGGGGLEGAGAAAKRRAQNALASRRRPPGASLPAPFKLDAGACKLNGASRPFGPNVGAAGSPAALGGRRLGSPASACYCKQLAAAVAMGEPHDERSPRQPNSNGARRATPDDYCCSCACSCARDLKQPETWLTPATPQPARGQRSLSARAPPRSAELFVYANSSDYGELPNGADEDEDDEEEPLDGDADEEEPSYRRLLEAGRRAHHSSSAGNFEQSGGCSHHRRLAAAAAAAAGHSNQRHACKQSFRRAQRYEGTAARSGGARGAGLLAASNQHLLYNSHSFHNGGGEPAADGRRHLALQRRAASTRHEPARGRAAGRERSPASFRADSSDGASAAASQASTLSGAQAAAAAARPLELAAAGGRQQPALPTTPASVAGSATATAAEEARRAARRLLCRRSSSLTQVDGELAGQQRPEAGPDHKRDDDDDDFGRAEAEARRRQRRAIAGREYRARLQRLEKQQQQQQQQQREPQDDNLKICVLQNELNETLERADGRFQLVSASIGSLDFEPIEPRSGRQPGGSECRIDMGEK